MAESNQAHYDLSRKPAKISTLSSKDVLDKYEYLTGEDLRYKPNVFEQAKFEHPPLVMTLNTGIKPADDAKNLIHTILV